MKAYLFTVKKSSLHLSGRNNKIIFGKNCNIVNCRIKLYGNSTLVLGDDCYFENTLIMLRDSEARFGNKHRKGCRLLNRLRVFWALFSAK